MAQQALCQIPGDGIFDEWLYKMLGCRGEYGMKIKNILHFQKTIPFAVRSEIRSYDKNRQKSLKIFNSAL